MRKQITIFILIIPLIIIGIIVFNQAFRWKKRIESPVIDIGYCFIESNDTIIKAYSVFAKKDIDKLIKYYDSKIFNKYEYYFDDYSFLTRIPLDKQINVKSYLRDSTIISFSYKVYNHYRGDTMERYGYVPVYTFHPTN